MSPIDGALMPRCSQSYATCQPLVRSQQYCAHFVPEIVRDSSKFLPREITAGHRAFRRVGAIYGLTKCKGDRQALAT